MRPSPVDDLRHVDAVLIGVVAVVQLPVQQRLARMRPLHLEDGTRLIAPIVKVRRSTLFSIASSIGVLMLPRSLWPRMWKLGGALNQSACTSLIVSMSGRHPASLPSKNCAGA